MTKENKELEKLLSDKEWRLFSWKLYYIKDKYWNKIPFIPNEAQTHYYKNRHVKNIILKARQLWFSTLIDIDKLDDFLFTSYCNYWIIAQDLNAANSIFNEKIKFAFDNLPEWLKIHFKLKTDRRWELTCESNSNMISVDTSFRSSTLQWLHISEFWKICAKYPEKAREIITWALNTVAPTCKVDVESTAEWNSGPFYDMSMKALEDDESWKELTDMDYKFFFYPWFLDKTYTLEEDIPITDDTRRYFEELTKEEYINRKYPWIKFTEWQMRWWQKKKEEQKDDMGREYPSFPKEAFDLAVKWAYYKKELSLARTQWRVRVINYDNKLPVYTHWDIWGAWWWDETAIWFYQLYGKEVRLLEYWQWSWMWLTEIWASIVQTKSYNYATHYFPHDIEVTEYWTWVSRYETAKKVFWHDKVKVVPKLSISDWINAVRDMFINCYFDETKCIVWLQMLSQYRRQWDDKNWLFLQKPIDRHKCKHGSDAFRYLAVTYSRLTRDDSMFNQVTQQKPVFHNKMTGKMQWWWFDRNEMAKRFWL